MIIFFGPLVKLVINNVYWLKSSNKNVCPDINIGRFCVKTTITYNYLRNFGNNNPYLIFLWQFLANNIISTTLNAAPTNTQVINNLGFFTSENTAIVLDARTRIQQTLPVTVELRTDNIQTNGIWCIYQLGTGLNVHTTHDPVFGINQNGQTLTTEIVSLALTVGGVLFFLVILSCSIYLYRGNTQNYYRKMTDQLTIDETQSEEPFTDYY